MLSTLNPASLALEALVDPSLSPIVTSAPENLEKDLKAALSHKNRLVFVDVITDQTENVYPMIVSGKGHHEMHLAPSANEDIELA